jgi:hypothetical protein
MLLYLSLFVGILTPPSSRLGLGGDPWPSCRAANGPTSRTGWIIDAQDSNSLLNRKITSRHGRVAV